MARQHSTRFLLFQARKAERAGELPEAVDLYNQIVKQDPEEDYAYNRLMVYYRRQKEYRKELQVIRSAIAAHEQHAADYQQAWIKRNKTTARVAKALVKSLGLVDRKGKPVLENRQLAVWKKRMTVVRKRLKQE
jgi:tetratricopeptide (TPR) repeat protein